jgi:TRAP-type C4-dicarboxylate transport system substrate-binding protein
MNVSAKLRTIAATVCAALALGAAGSAAAQQKPIVLRGVTPWTADYDLSQAFVLFKRMVDERLAGKVTINYLGGPEVSAPDQQIEGVRNGVFDIALGATAYYRSQVPLSPAVQFTKKLPSELRKSGYYDLMRQLHLEEGNLVYLANTGGGNKFRMYLRKPIQKADFTGLKLRVSPVYIPLTRALNGTPISIAPGEVYTALERGVIDGYGWTYTGIYLFGWQEHTKAVIDHPFYSMDTGILMNRQAWERLPKDVQASLTRISADLEVQIEKDMAQRLRDEDAKLKKMGLQFIHFPPAEADKYLKAAYDEGWKDFVGRNKALFEKNPGLLEKLQKLGS